MVVSKIAARSGGKFKIFGALVFRQKGPVLCLYSKSKNNKVARIFRVVSIDAD